MGRTVETDTADAVVGITLVMGALYFAGRSPVAAEALLKLAADAQKRLLASAASVHTGKKCEKPNNDFLGDAGIACVNGNDGKSAEGKYNGTKGPVCAACSSREFTFLVKKPLAGFFLGDSGFFRLADLPFFSSSGKVNDEALCDGLRSCDHFFVVRRNGFRLLVKNTVLARLLSIFGLVHLRSLSEARNVAEQGN